MRIPLCRAVRKRPLPLRSHVVAVALAAVLALSVQQATAADALGGNYNYYFGNLHSHTSYSDGVLTPSDAFRHARYAAKMDFHAVTDHGYYMQEATNLHHWFLPMKRPMSSTNPAGLLRLWDMSGHSLTVT